MTDENNQIKFFLYENWARTKTGQHTVLINLSNFYGCLCDSIKKSDTFKQMRLRFALVSSDRARSCRFQKKCKQYHRVILPHRLEA